MFTLRNVSCICRPKKDSEKGKSFSSAFLDHAFLKTSDPTLTFLMVR